MPLSDAKKRCIEDVIKTSLRQKLKKYRPETKEMPFHYRLLGKDRMALYSFIQSLNTTFGISIYEPVSEILASGNFATVDLQHSIGTRISTSAQTEIQKIMDELSSGQSDPSKLCEIERIRKVCTHGEFSTVKTVKVDVFLESQEGEVHIFDIKTAKPNISNYKDFKRTLLEWIAIYLAKNPDATIHSYIAIPYNPYHPDPYERWTVKGMLELDQELKVAEEFWDFLHGDCVYSDLLDCFERAGIELRTELDDYFAKFQKKDSE